MIVCPLCGTGPYCSPGWLGDQAMCSCARLQVYRRGRGGTFWSPCGFGVRVGLFFMADGSPEVWWWSPPWSRGDPDSVESHLGCLAVLES